MPQTLIELKLGELTKCLGRLGELADQQEVRLAAASGSATPRATPRAPTPRSCTPRDALLAVGNALRAIGEAVGPKTTAGQALLEKAGDDAGLTTLARLISQVASKASAAIYLTQDSSDLATICFALEKFLLLKVEELKRSPHLAAAVSACLQDALRSVTEQQTPGHFAKVFLGMPKEHRLAGVYTRLIAALRPLGYGGAVQGPHVEGLPESKEFEQTAELLSLVTSLGGPTAVLSSSGDSAQLEMTRRKTDKFWAATYTTQRARVLPEKAPQSGFWSAAAPK